MYFLIIFIGIVLLIVNFLQWRRNIAAFASETQYKKNHCHTSI